MDEFLRGFHKRMEKLSYSFLIDSKVSTLGTFNKYNIDNIEGLNLVYTLMCFIMDKSLKDEECTISNMKVFLEDILLNYYKKELTEDELQELVRFIVIKILRNDGNQFVFKTLDYKENKAVEYEFHLLNQKVSNIDSNKSTYYLTKEGYRLILSSLEVDERTQIDINQLILEMSLKKKNFSQGLMAIETLNNLVTSQVNVLNQFILKVRENIFTIEQKEFEENFIKNLEVLKEQNRKFDDIKKTIDKEEERINNLNKKITEDEYEALKQLRRIKKLLILTTHKAGELINKHFEFKKEYKRALDEATLYYSNKRIDIKNDILKEVEKNPEVLGEAYKIFNPLFLPSINKRFNINYMFNSQKIYSKEEEEEALEIQQSSIEEEEIEKENLLKEQYYSLVSELLSFVIRERNTSLKDYISYIENNDNIYKKAIPDVRKFGEVLIDLLKIGTINMEEIMEEEDKSYEDRDLIFDLRGILVREFTNKYKLHTNINLNFYKDLNGETVDISERDENEMGIVNKLNCPNIIIKITTVGE